MPSVFISYRRADAAYAASMIYEKIKVRFGEGSVFIDIDTIPAGVDFRDHIARWIARCDVFLVIIGDSWLKSMSDVDDEKARSNTDDARDFVRFEIATALERGIPVLPILVGHADIPAPQDLPPDLKALSFMNAAEIRIGRTMDRQFERLFQDIERIAVSKGVVSSSNGPVRSTGVRPAPQPNATGSKSDEPWLRDIPRDVSGRPHLGGISLIKFMGMGGAGVIYEGYHHRLDCKVAVRLFPSGWETVGSTRFGELLFEARTLMKIQSLNVVRVLDVSEDAGYTFAVIEYVEGGVSADKYLSMHPADNPIPELDATRIIIGATRGMTAAHDIGVIHRDIRLPNLLIPWSSRDVPPAFFSTKLLDFGFARIIDGEKERPAVAPTPYTSGPLGYMAPETARGEVADARSDIFSMGVCLYHLLTGELPFPGESIRGLLFTLMTEPPVPLPERREGLSTGVCDIVERCLCKDSAGRFQSGHELLAELARLDTPLSGLTQWR